MLKGRIAVKWRLSVRNTPRRCDSGLNSMIEVWNDEFIYCRRRESVPIKRHTNKRSVLGQICKYDCETLVVECEFQCLSTLNSSKIRTKFRAPYIIGSCHLHFQPESPGSYLFSLEEPARTGKDLIGM